MYPIQLITVSMRNCIILCNLIIFTCAHFNVSVERLANLHGTDLAEELSGQFEGDIVLSPEQEESISSRTGLINERYRWTNNVVPFEIDATTFRNIIHVRVRVLGTNISSTFQMLIK